MGNTNLKELSYGDRRDRVKWGALIYLANEFDIPCIIQVAYLRQGTDDPKLKVGNREVALPEEVWNHFSDLKHIQRLATKTGKLITVLDEPFHPMRRDYYIASIVSKNHEDTRS